MGRVWTVPVAVTAVPSPAAAGLRLWGRTSPSAVAGCDGPWPAVTWPKLDPRAPSARGLARKPYYGLSQPPEAGTLGRTPRAQGCVFAVAPFFFAAGWCSGQHAGACLRRFPRLPTHFWAHAVARKPYHGLPSPAVRFVEGGGERPPVTSRLKPAKARARLRRANHTMVCRRRRRLGLSGHPLPWPAVT